MQIVKISLQSHEGEVPKYDWSLVGDRGSSSVSLVVVPTMWPKDGELLPFVETTMPNPELVAYLRDGIKAFVKALYNQDIPVGTGPAWTVQDGTAMMPVASFLYGRSVETPWWPNGWELSWLLKQSPALQGTLAQIWPATDIAKTGVGMQWAIVDPPTAVSVAPYGVASEGAAPGEDPKAAQQYADEEAPPIYLAMKPGWTYLDPIPPYTPGTPVTPPSITPPVQPVVADGAGEKKSPVWPWVALGVAATGGLIWWAASRPKANPTGGEHGMTPKQARDLDLIRTTVMGHSLCVGSVQGDDIVFRYYLDRGSKPWLTGEQGEADYELMSEHSLHLPVSSEKRVLAHWEGFCENHGLGIKVGDRVQLDPDHMRAGPRPPLRTPLPAVVKAKHGAEITVKPEGMDTEVTVGQRAITLYHAKRKHS